MYNVPRDVRMAELAAALDELDEPLDGIDLGEILNNNDYDASLGELIEAVRIARKKKIRDAT